MKLILHSFFLFKTKKTLSCVHNLHWSSFLPAHTTLDQTSACPWVCTVSCASGSRLNMLNLINARALLPSPNEINSSGRRASSNTWTWTSFRRNVRLIVSPRVRSSPVTLGDTRPRRLRGPRCLQVTEYLEDVAQNDNTNKQKCRNVGRGKTQEEKL